MKTKKFLFKFYTLTLMIALLFSTALAASGTLDLTFGNGGMVVTDLGSTSDSGNSVILQSDGKILMLGDTYLNPDDPYQVTPVISRYTSSGLLDSTFGLSGMLFADSSRFYKSKFALQPDGKLILARSIYSNFNLTRYNNNGTLDTAFGDNGSTVLDLYGDSIETLADVTVQTDGKIVAVGDHRLSGSNFIDFFIARFNTDGSMDSTFVANGIMILDKTNFPNNRYNSGKAVAIQPDKKIIISGNMMDDNGDTQISLVRLNPDGYPDSSTFGTNGQGTVMVPLPGFRHSSGAIVLQADGKFIIAGTIFDEENNISLDTVMIRFNSNGSLDASFGGTGIVVTDLGANEYGADIHLQADGKIVMVGTSSTLDSGSLLIVRYNSNGSLDNTFGNGGKLIGNPGTSGAGVEIQPDSRVLAVGSTNGDAALFRYNVSTPIVGTFKSVGAYDGWILESAEFSNAGGLFDKLATTFNLGDDQRDRQYRSILSFNTAALPDQAVVTSAQLRIKRQGLVGTDPFTTHGALYLNITNRAFSNNLALQLIDFNAAFSAGSTQDQITADALGWYTANLSQTNLNFINKVGLTQFRLNFDLDDNDDLGSDYMKFFSGNSIAANMPQLVITYAP